MCGDLRHMRMPHNQFRGVYDEYLIFFNLLTWVRSNTPGPERIRLPYKYISVVVSNFKSYIVARASRYTFGGHYLASVDRLSILVDHGNASSRHPSSSCSRWWRSPAESTWKPCLSRRCRERPTVYAQSGRVPRPTPCR